LEGKAERVQTLIVRERGRKSNLEETGFDSWEDFRIGSEGRSGSFLNGVHGDGKTSGGR